MSKEYRRLNNALPPPAEHCRLQAAGLIRGYRADVSPRALGYQITAMIRLSTRQGRPYEQFVQQRAEIVDCYTVTGEDGAVMRVLATDVKHLQRIINDLNAFGSTSTAIVLTTHVDRKAISLPEA
jgi:Lrp/AsnC family leucine-responsive transcriptional regulator